MPNPNPPAHPALRLNAARALIGLVLFFNLQCAVLFLAQPEQFAPGFELQGEIGARMIQAMGLLFVMWNVPYAVALFHPGRHWISLVEALVMQAIGVIGETGLLFQVVGDHPALRASVQRFILFDASGLLLLALAFLFIHPVRTFHLTQG